MRFRVFLDAGSGAFVWGADAETWERYGIPTDLRMLGISQELQDEAEAICRDYDEAFPWDDPGAGEMEWSADEEAVFEARVRAFSEALQLALGGRADVSVEV